MGILSENKSEIFKAFKMWKAMVENETELKIKSLRIENDGEYEDTGFKKLCYEDEIKIERVISSTPQHNGMSEHMNQTLIDRVRSLCV